MTLLKRSTDIASQAHELSTKTAKQLQARSKYFGHLAAAQSYRAAASAQDLGEQARGYARRYPMRLVGVFAAIAGLLLSLGLYRRGKR